MSISLHLKTATGEPIIWHTITELDAFTLTVLRVSNDIIVEQKNKFICYILCRTNEYFERVWGFHVLFFSVVWQLGKAYKKLRRDRRML